MKRQPTPTTITKNDKYMKKSINLLHQLSLKVMVLAAGFMLFSTWVNANDTPVTRVIADNANNVKPVLNGQMIPDVTIYDVNDKGYSLKELVKEKPAILVFYRGGWCPYCSSQLGRLKESESELIELGYQLIAISPDSPERLQNARLKSDFKAKIMSDKVFDATEQFGVGYFLEDKVANIYRNKLGVEFVNINGESRVALPVPAIYIVGTDGLVHFNYVNPNYKVRLDEELLIQAAKVLNLSQQ